MSGWGQAHINNTIGFGQGSTNNSVNWGSSYGNSFSGDTALASGGGFTGLLDDYPGAAAAYSLRQLSSSYTGSAIRVRRSSDNTEQDIGFVSNELDTASLLSFVGAGVGFVTTWYDQSGSGGNNATQATASAQPQIVSSGSLILENGKPALLFSGNQLLNTTNVAFNNGITSFNIFKPNSYTAGDFWTLMYLSNGVDNAYGVSFSLNGNYDYRNIILGTQALSNDGIPINLNQQLLSSYYDGNGTAPTDADLYINGVQGTLNSSRTWGTIRTGSAIGFYPSGSASNYFQGNIQEIVVYENNQSANRLGINTNINNFYSIY